MSREALIALIGSVSADYEARLRHELDVIVKKNFSGYFLIVADFIREAKTRGIPVGPGRGSAAGSLVAYALGITEVDPLKHGLIFERFLNPERTAMPDIDVDICQTRREEVIEYVRQRYGHDRVAQIITFGTLGAKAVLRDVARVHELPAADADKLAGLVPDQLKISLGEAIEKVPELKALATGTYRELFATAMKLEGQVRHASRHAAGVVIGNVPITEVAPFYRDSDGHIVTQYDMISIEALGLLKIDILGLKTLSMIARAEELIGPEGATSGPERLDDAKVYELLSSGRTLGVFQLDSTGIRDLIVKLKPGRFDDLVALIALYRPGPMNLADEFVARRHGRAEVVYEPAAVEPILESTYGVILYQEQVMQIANAIGGFSLAEADNLRKAMGKKNPELMASYRQKFLRGAAEREFDSDVAERLFDQMERFAGYGFNKSHAVAYGIVAYRTARLKAYYPVEFMAALLSFESDNHPKLAVYLQECEKMGIPIFAPRVDRPSVYFTPDEEDGRRGIRYGLAAVKNVGVGACEAIKNCLEIDREPFQSLWDFLCRVERKHVNRRATEALIEVGAFDALGSGGRAPTRRAMIEALPVLWERAAGAGDTSQQSLFGAEEMEPRVEEKEEYPDLAEREYRHLGYYLQGHPLLARFPELAFVPQSEPKPGTKVWLVGSLDNVEVIFDKRGKEMARATIVSPARSVGLVVFHSVYLSCKAALTANEGAGRGPGVFVRGKFEESGRMLVDEIVPLERVNWTLRVMVESADEEELKEVEAVLAQSGGGDVPVDLIVRQSGKAFRFQSLHRVNPASIGRALAGRPGVTVELLPR